MLTNYFGPLKEMSPFEYFILTDSKLELCYKTDLKIINFIDHVYDVITGINFNYFELKNKFGKDKEEEHFVSFIIYLKIHAIKQKNLFDYRIFNRVFFEFFLKEKKIENERMIKLFFSDNFEIFVNYIFNDVFDHNFNKLFEKDEENGTIEINDEQNFHILNILRIEKSTYKKMENLKDMIDIIREKYGILNIIYKTEIDFLKLIKITLKFGYLDLSTINLKRKYNEEVFFKKKTENLNVDQIKFEFYKHYFDKDLYSDKYTTWKRKGITFPINIDPLKFEKDSEYINKIEKMISILKKEKVTEKSLYFNYLAYLSIFFEEYNKLSELKFKRDYICRKIIYRHDISIHKIALYFTLIRYFKEKRIDISEHEVMSRIYIEGTKNEIIDRYEEISNLIKIVIDL